jgi:hypothetical protein
MTEASKLLRFPKERMLGRLVLTMAATQALTIPPSLAFATGMTSDWAARDFSLVRMIYEPKKSQSWR